MISYDESTGYLTSQTSGNTNLFVHKYLGPYDIAPEQWSILRPY